MWTAAQIKTFQRALAKCEKWEPAIARLEQMAMHAPQFAERVQEMRLRCDHLRNLSQLALASGQ